MVPPKFLRPWEVFNLDIPELDQEPQARNRYPVGVVDIASTFVFEYPLPFKGGLEISPKLYDAPSDPERYRGGVYSTNGKTLVSGPEKVDTLRSRQPNPIARIYRKDGGASREIGKSCPL